MSVLQNGVAGVLIVLGLIIMLVGSIGILRLPDFYTRSHAASKVDTTGIIFLLLGLAVLQGWNLAMVKLMIAVAIIMLANPVAIHALSRAAWMHGERPWMRKKEGED